MTAPLTDVSDGGPDTRMFVFKNQAADVERLMAALKGLSADWRLQDRVAQTLRLCAEELAVNIVENAFRDGEDHDIIARVSKTPLHLILSFEDDGDMFDPTENVPDDVPDPTALSEESHRGRGIMMVKTFSDALEYDFEGGRNIIRVYFLLDA